MGSAIDSARTRSSSMVVPTSWKTSAKPPTSTVMPSVDRRYFGDRSSTSSFTSFWVPSMRASTSARLPSSLRSGGGLPSDQYDTTLVRWGSAASSLVSAVPSGGHCGVVDRAARSRDEQDQVGRAGAEGVEQGLVGPERLGARVAEAAGAQVLGHAATEGSRHREQDGGGDEHHLATTNGESAEATEHVSAPRCGGWSCNAVNQPWAPGRSPDDVGHKPRWGWVASP